MIEIFDVCCTSTLVKLAFLSSRSGRDAYRAVLEQQKTGLVDLLAMFPSCKVIPARLDNALQLF